MKKEINLGSSSVSAVMNHISESIRNEENIEINFVKKTNNCICCIQMSFVQEEFFIDDQGVKWRKVYE